jgi:hypothetical protein
VYIKGVVGLGYVCQQCLYTSMNRWCFSRWWNRAKEVIFDQWMTSIGLAWNETVELSFFDDITLFNSRSLISTQMDYEASLYTNERKIPACGVGYHIDDIGRVFIFLGDHSRVRTIRTERVPSSDSDDVRDVTYVMILAGVRLRVPLSKSTNRDALSVIDVLDSFTSKRHALHAVTTALPRCLSCNKKTRMDESFYDHQEMNVHSRTRQLHCTCPCVLHPLLNCTMTTISDFLVPVQFHTNLHWHVGNVHMGALSLRHMLKPFCV